MWIDATGGSGGMGLLSKTMRLLCGMDQLIGP
jgi:hypothetical protein